MSRKRVSCHQVPNLGCYLVVGLRLQINMEETHKTFLTIEMVSYSLTKEQLVKMNLSVVAQSFLEASLVKISDQVSY